MLREANSREDRGHVWSHLLPASCGLMSWGMSEGTLQAEEKALDCMAHRRVSCPMSLSWVLGLAWSVGRGEAA